VRQHVAVCLLLGFSLQREVNDNVYAEEKAPPNRLSILTFSRKGATIQVQLNEAAASAHTRIRIRTRTRTRASK
jgi:hypothetical protein